MHATYIALVALLTACGAETVDDRSAPNPDHPVDSWAGDAPACFEPADYGIASCDEECVTEGYAGCIGVRFFGEDCSVAGEEFCDKPTVLWGEHLPLRCVCE